VVVGAKPVRRVAAAAPAPKLKVVRKAPVSAPATGSKPTAAASTKTDTKADTKADTKKNWVDPFAQ
jgi:hypothetical protein